MSKPVFQILSGLLLSAVSAVLLRLAYPPYPLGLVIWFAFIPMLLAQYRILPPRISSLAPALAISGWMGTLLIPAFGGKSIWMVFLPAGIFLIVFLTDQKKRAFHEKTKYRWFILEGVLGWVGIEMIRSLIPAIGTWAFVGYALWNHPWLIQPLSIFGIYGLDLVIMCSNYALGLGLLWLVDPILGRDTIQIPVRVLRVGVICFFVVLIGWIGLSLWLDEGLDPTYESIKVAAIQPNLPRPAHKDTVLTNADRLTILTKLTHQAAAQGAQLIVWPEMALGFDPQVTNTSELHTLALNTQAYTVIGYVIDNEDGFRNQSALLAPNGEILGVYSKNHPMVTSGEPKSQGAGKYPGFETSIGKLGMMICFDASFSDVARRMGNQGVEIIANPSLFGSSIAHLTQVMPIFRAIENRVAIVMADVAYNSAIIDPFGRVRQSTTSQEGRQAILVADIPLVHDKIFYTRFGDWLGWVSLCGMLLIAFWIAKIKRF